MVLSKLVRQTRKQGVIVLMVNDKDRKYSELSTVKQQENELVPEEFPDGAFGSAIGQDTPVFSKDRKSTRLNSSHVSISYAVFCLKKKNKKIQVREIEQKF